MPKIDIDSYWDDDFYKKPNQHKNSSTVSRSASSPKAAGKRQQQLQSLSELIQIADKAPVDLQQGFTTTFKPAEHERFWLLSYLEPFYNNEVITDILWKAKGGKEANVYCCAAHPSTGAELIAAKVYRPRMLRNLRNDALYRQGRGVMDENGKATPRSRREALAMKKNTRFGKELRHTSWLEAEYQTMQVLYDAGADVPKPIVHGDNVIMMEYVGEEKMPAPTLNEVYLDRSEALPMFERLVEDLAIMLSCHRVHADFSAYNILYWDGLFKIIDFPQAVDPRRNPNAMALFVRDVERLCQYFRRYGIKKDALALANDLWGRFVRTNALDASAAGEDFTAEI
jgi:RIO kinase 1